MTIQNKYMGWHVGTGFWAFSPSRIKNAEFVWDISEWSFDDIWAFMQLESDMARLALLAETNTTPVKYDYEQ